jgi:hypothetical protein
MSFANRDKARRFISLVDELYNARVALVCRYVGCGAHAVPSCAVPQLQAPQAANRVCTASCSAPPPPDLLSTTTPLYHTGGGLV